MSKRFAVAVIAAAVLAALPLGAAEPAPKLERIEWSDIWITDADRDELPRVLLVGDSIVRGYYDGVEKALAGKAACARYTTSKFLGNPDYAAELGLILDRHRYGVIHINNGLHGWDCTEEEYRKGLEALVVLLREKAPGAKVVWGMTTPVRVAGDLAHLDADKNARAVARNQIAAEIMGKNSIPVTDLYAALADRPDLFADDGVHHNAKGRELLARMVADAVGKCLPKE